MTITSEHCDPAEKERHKRIAGLEELFLDIDAEFLLDETESRFWPLNMKLRFPIEQRSANEKSSRSLAAEVVFLFPF